MKLHPGHEQRPSDSNFVDMEMTPMHEVEIGFYLREAWKYMMGDYPSKESLAILWSQVVLETGRNTDRTSNSMMRNWNYGNIKRNFDYSPSYTSYKAGEFLNGKHQLFYPYHPQTFFAAWKGPFEGALGYITFLAKRKRYAQAWIELQKGDTAAFVTELKIGGYFTAPLDKYLNFVLSRVKEFDSKYERVLEFKGKLPPLAYAKLKLPETQVSMVALEDLEVDVDLSNLNSEYQVIETVPAPEKKVSEHKVVEAIPVPENQVYDLIPEPYTGETKLHFISRIFYTIWGYFQQFLTWLRVRKN